MTLSPKATRSAGGRHGFPWRAAGLVLVTMFALAGAGLITVALTQPEPLHPPQPDPAAAPPFLLSPSPSQPSPAPSVPGPATPSPSGERGGVGAGQADREGSTTGGAASRPRPQPSPKPVGMSRSTPVRVKVPRIGVDAEITRVGLDGNGQLVVPPLDKPQLAGWYELGPSPGEVGNAVVVGHVDSRSSGPAVFFNLGALNRGDIIEIVRADGKVAKFLIDGVARYPKNNFPTELVYGPTNQAQLRLITCGGAFDSTARSYQDNIVVFATLLKE